jgi:hypothetical protein
MPLGIGEQAMKKAAFAFIVLILAGLACQLPGGSSSPKVLFSDDFSNENSGWPTINESAGSANYKDGGYELTIPSPDSGYWASPELEDQTNVTIEVDAAVTGSARDSDFGVLCRGLDADNHYLLLISADGYAMIGKFKNGEFVTLSSEDWVPSSAVKQGSQLNHIRADCVDNTFALYANGELIATATDDDFSTGMVGVTIGSYQDPNGAVMFDNFVVTENTTPIDVNTP